MVNIKSRYVINMLTVDSFKFNMITYYKFNKNKQCNVMYSY